jgi:hypothetical protein
VVPESVVEYLVWYHLGSLGGERSIDSVSLASILKQHFITQEILYARYPRFIDDLYDY